MKGGICLLLFVSRRRNKSIIDRYSHHSGEEKEGLGIRNIQVEVDEDEDGECITLQHLKKARQVLLSIHTCSNIRSPA